MIGRILFLLIPILGAIAIWYFYQNVLINLTIVSKKIGCSKRKLLLLHQTHSNKFIYIEKNYKFNKKRIKADALITNVKNVGRILVGGLRELSVRVWIDPIKLAANNLTIQEVEQALRSENLSLPAGTLEANNIDLTINLDKSYNDLSIGDDCNRQWPRVGVEPSLPRTASASLGKCSIGSTIPVSSKWFTNSRMSSGTCRVVPESAEYPTLITCMVVSS